MKELKVEKTTIESNLAQIHLQTNKDANNNFETQKDKSCNSHTSLQAMILQQKL